MEKVDIFSVNYERRKHIIHCDICGKLIATEIEYDDGYYCDHMYEIRQSNFDYIYRRQLCTTCIHEVNLKYIEMLENFGFEQNIE